MDKNDNNRYNNNKFLNKPHIMKVLYRALNCNKYTKNVMSKRLPYRYCSNSHQTNWHYIKIAFTFLVAKYLLNAP